MIVEKQAYGRTVPAELNFIDRMANREPDRNGNYQRDSFIAYLLALASSWAYSDADTVADAMGRLGFPHCRQISLSNEAMLIQANAFFLQSDDGREGILCFRGTEPRNVINWLTDASVRVEPVPGMGRIHGGFYRNVIYIWHRIESVIEEALAGTLGVGSGNGHKDLAPLEDLYVSGHSLGAAMAVIAAAKIYGSERYREWKRRVRGIYTFGQPIVGDGDFANVGERWFGPMLFRHIYQHDLVPHLPPISTGRFVHFGQEYRGSESGWEASNTVVRQASSVALTSFVGVTAWVFQQIRFLGRIQLPFSIDDHSPNNYLHASRAEIGSEWYSDIAIGGAPSAGRRAPPAPEVTAH
jgi:hypothetical protein